jgi:hypothetical protein
MLHYELMLSHYKLKKSQIELIMTHFKLKLTQIKLVVSHLELLMTHHELMMSHNELVKEILNGIKKPHFHGVSIVIFLRGYRLLYPSARFYRRH